MAAQWVRTDFLGEGSYGCVYLAQPLYSSSCKSPTLAVKSSFEYSGIVSLQSEKNILYELRGCPQIIQCFGDDCGVDEKGRKVYNLLLEYAPGGTLHELLEICGTLPEYEASCYANMLLKGLSHVHEEGYVHCDIKPSNVLVFPSATGLIKNFLKLADFGLAKRAEEKTNKDHSLLKYRGTLMYSSPESVILGEHEAPVDIWSLGCVMVEILVGVSFWSGVIKDDVFNIFNYDDTWLEYLFMEYKLSKIAMDFLRRCLKRDVRERWTADQLLQHPFITEYSKTCMPLKVETEMEYPKTPFNSSFVSELSLIAKLTF